MMRLLAILTVAVGCTPAEPPSYVPAISVAVGVAAATDPQPMPDEPDSDECDNCGGTGEVGDGTVMVDCPVCGGTGYADTDETKMMFDAIERLILRLEAIERRLQKLESKPTPSEPAAGEAPPLPLILNADEEPGNEPAAGFIQWVDIDRATISPQPTWLHFTMKSGCRWCEKQESEVFTDERVIAASRQLACVEVLSTDALCQRFGITAFPSEVIINADGQVRRMAPSGSVSAGLFAKYLGGSE